MLPDFIEDINRHMENLAYSDYEHTAKRSIAYYIELLRTNNEETISYEVLHEKIIIAKTKCAFFQNEMCIFCIFFAVSQLVLNGLLNGF